MLVAGIVLGEIKLPVPYYVNRNDTARKGCGSFDTVGRAALYFALYNKAVNNNLD